MSTRKPVLSSPFSHTTRALALDGVAPALWAWGLAALALLAWTAWFLGGEVAVVEVSHRARLEVQQAAHVVNAPLAGRLQVAPPPMGTVVQAGELLWALDAQALVLRLREAQAHRQGLLAQVAALHQEIAARHQAQGLDQHSAVAAEQGASARLDEAAAAAAYARDQASRLAAESAAGGVARVAALQAQAEAQKLAAAQQAQAADARRSAADARSRQAQQRAQLDGLQRTLATLQAEAAVAASTVERLTLDIAQHSVRAPVAGRVGERAPLHAGEFVAAGQALVTLIPEGRLIAVAEFAPAAALGRVQPGQSALLRLDGFPWAQYGTVAATVSRVAGEIRDQHIRVEFTPVAGWPAGIQAQHGLPGSVAVTLETVAPARLLLRASGQRLTAAAPS